MHRAASVLQVPAQKRFVPWSSSKAKHFTRVTPGPDRRHQILLAVGGGVFTAALCGTEAFAAERMTTDQALLRLKALGNKREAVEAHENLKREMRIKSDNEKTADWDQLIFVIKASIEAKRLKEELAQAKKREEIELQGAMASNEALKKEAEKQFNQREKVIRAQCQRDFEAKMRHEMQIASERLRQVSQEIKHDFDDQLQGHMDNQNSIMVRELVDKFKGLRDKSDSIVNKVVTTLQKKENDFNYQDKFVEENRRLVNLHQKCTRIESALRIDKRPGGDWTKQMCPIDDLAYGIVEAFQGQDELGQIVAKGLPQTVVKRGVLTEVGLRGRFHEVSKVAHRLAMLKEDGPYSGSMYLGAYLRSLVTVPQKYCNPDLTSDFVPDNLDNADLLFRASACVENNDIRNAVKFMERLQGAPVNAVAGWLNEAHNYLRVVQSINILKSYCTLKINRSCNKSPVIMVSGNEEKE